MRISNTNPNSNIGRAKQASSGQKSKRTFSVEDDAQTQGTSAAAATQAPANLSSLLSIQNFDEEESNKQSAQQGAKILDELDNLKIALLSGQMPTQKLAHLSALAHAMPRGSDPNLNKVLDEIEIRAKVELEKLKV